MTLESPLITRLECLPSSVADPYSEAFKTCAVLPGYALVQIRGALSALVDLWLRHVHRGTGGSLGEQTDRLVRTLGLGALEAGVFQEVRVAGNLGAHPEQRMSGPPTRAEARHALRGMHTLMCLYAERVGGRTPSELAAFEEPPDVDWGDVCERAIFGRDPVSMLAVGRRLVEVARARADADERLARADKRWSWSPDPAPFLDAVRWFEGARASADTAVARAAAFEHARVLIVEAPPEGAPSAGLALLRAAAAEGHADAQALLALLLLDPRSPLPQPRDLAEARGWAERAAESEHPEALNVLTAIYGNGQGVERDPARALAYARRSSDAGYPLAHANLALLLLDQPSGQRDEAEIRALIARGRAEDVGEAAWAEYRLAQESEMPDGERAGRALSAAVEARVVPALLTHASIAMRDDPASWDLGACLGCLTDVLARVEDGDARASAVALLRRLRDEADRRMRNPASTQSGPKGDELFSLVIQAGACLDLRAGQDPVERADYVMRALGRVCSPLPVGRQATEDDVHLVLSAIPTFPVRWKDGRATLIDPSSTRKAPVDASPNGKLARRRVPKNGPCPCGSGRRYKGCCGRT